MPADVILWLLVIVVPGATPNDPAAGSMAQANLARSQAICEAERGDVRFRSGGWMSQCVPVRARWVPPTAASRP